MKTFEFDQIEDDAGRVSFRSSLISNIGSLPSQRKVAKFTVKLKRRGISMFEHYSFVSKMNDSLTRDLYGE